MAGLQDAGLHPSTSMAENTPPGEFSESFSDSEIEREIGPLAYAFEPIQLGRDSDEDESNSDSDSDSGTDSEEDGDGPEPDPDHRLGNTHWCTCANCGPMTTVKECLCCQDIPAIQEKLVDNAQEDDLQCITHNVRFYWICLDSEALETAMLSMSNLRADSLVKPMNSR